MAAAAEGTRKRVKKLKRAFYFIALKANVPIITVAFDFGKKEVNLGNPVLPSGAIENDLLLLHEHFKGVIGKIAYKGFSIA